MGTNTARLLHDALDLEPAERAEFAAALLQSLEGPGPEAGQGWLAEIERRARRALAGTSAGTPWPEVRQKLAESLAR